jgi:competence protein ComEC
MFRTYPSLLLLGAVVGGIIVADLCHPAIIVLLTASILTGLVGILFAARGRTLVAPILFALALALLAATHFAHLIYDLPPSHFSRVADPRQNVQIYGEVADWPELKADFTSIIIRVDSLGGTIAQRATGRLLLKISDTTTALQRGDRVEFFGRIYPVESRSAQSGFDYNRYLNLKGIFGNVYLPGVLDIRVDRRPELGFLSLVDRLRAGIRELLYANLSPSSAALASGFLIGETRDIPVEVYQRFRDSGTLHLMAVSGSNVAVVLAFFMIALAPFSFGRATRALVLLTVIILFAALSYGEPSVLRASVMAALVILVGVVQRRYDLNNIIALSMLIILLFDPAELFDIGFQLSFATAWGLIFMVPRVTELFRTYHNRRWYRWIVFPLIISFVAQLASAPLIGCYFGKIPLVSLAANLVIVPLASVALVGILVMLLSHLILPVVGLFVGRLLDLLLMSTLWSVNLFGSGHSPMLELPQSLPPYWWGAIVATFFILLFTATLALRSKSARRWLVALILIGTNSALVAGVIHTSKPDSARLSVMTVPGGIAALYSPVGDIPDLIITGLTDKPYQIDDKIFVPWLHGHNVNSLKNVILLSCKFDALDDIIRLADGFGARRLYVSTACETSFRQVWREIEPNFSADDRVRFFGGETLKQSVGYSLCRESVTLNLPSVRLDFVQSVDDLPSLDSIKDNRPIIALIGRAWKADPEDWIALHNAGVGQIVCPKNIQRTVQVETDPHATAEHPLPAYLHQLSRLGEMEITLTDPLRIGPR